MECNPRKKNIDNHVPDNLYFRPRDSWSCHLSKLYMNE